MRLLVHTNNRGTLDIEDFDPDSVLAMVEALNRDEVKVLAFALPDGMAYIPNRAISRIDVLD